jgi:hypothetical protein
MPARPASERTSADFDARTCRTGCASDASRISRPSDVLNVAASARVSAMQRLASAVNAAGDRPVVATADPMYAGNALETTSNRPAVLVSRDNTRVTVQPRSQLKVENFACASGNPSKGSGVFGLLPGGMRVLTRVVDKAWSQAVALGIRPSQPATA